MGNRTTLSLLLVAALLAGGALFWLSGENRRSGAPAPASPRVSESGVPAAPAELQAPEVLPIQPASPEAGARVEVAPSGAEAPQAAKKSEPTARVRGRVVDRHGAAVAGARVLASSQSGFPLDLESDRDFPWFERLEVQTDAQGKFEFAGLQPGVVQMGVRAAGFAPFDRQGIGVPAEEAVELAPFTLARGAILTGVVLDPGGRGVPGAEIARIPLEDSGGFFLMGRREPAAVSRADGSFRIDQLACGPWRFSVRAEEHPDLVVEGSAEEPGVEHGGLRWELAPGATIQGSVTGIPAEERGKLEVRAGRGDAFALAFGPARAAEVDSSGVFLLRGLDVGQSYEIQARRADRAPLGGFWERSRSNGVTARAGDSGVVLAYQPEAALLFTVTDSSTGQVLERFQVESGVDWPAPLRDEEGRPRGHFPGGNVRVGGLRPTGSEERAQLVVRATGYREFRREGIAVRAGQELDLGVIRLDPVPVVRVRVLDSERGEPVAGALVRIEKDMGDMHAVRHSIEIGDSGGEETFEFGDGRSARTDEQGWAEITSYEGETVKLSARAPGYAPAELAGLFLPTGQRVEQELRLTRGGEVLVRVSDAEGQPLSGARVEHREPNAPGMIMMGAGAGGQVTDSAGEVVFTNLEAGTHSFRLDQDGSGSAGPVFATADSVVVSGMSGGGGDWSEVDVLEGERVQLSLRAAPRGSLAGRVREAGKVLPGAVLRLTEADAEEEELTMLLPGMSQGPEARADGEGRYRIEDVKEGRYKLSVEHPTRRMPQEFSLEVRAGDNVFDVDLPLSILEGRVLGPDRQPLAGVRVWPERQSEEGGAPRARFTMLMIDDGGGGGVLSSGDLGGKSATTDAEGHYVLRGVASDADMVVKAEGDTVQPGSSEVVRVAPDEVKQGVDIELAAGGALRVEAELADGTPARFCMVEARYLGQTEPPLEPKFSFIQSGSTTLKGLKPGRWSVNVRKAEGPGRGNSGAEQEIEVKAAETAEASFQIE